MAPALLHPLGEGASKITSLDMQGYSYRLDNFWWTTHFNRTPSDEMIAAVWVRLGFAHREGVQLAENVSVQPDTVGA